MLRNGFVKMTGNGHRPEGSRSRRLQVAILGAGFGGLGIGARLSETGLADFTIYEKADGVGGTWRDNSYPGAACDVPSHLYSFSFEPVHDWPRRFSEQADILSYLEHLTDKYGLRPNLRLGTEITEIRWDEASARWRLSAASGETFEADVVVSGLGQLNRPAVPAIEGLADFAGTTFHSARWDHDHDLRGERVAVIGNGASAVQFVPRIAPEVGRLHVFQRTPNWVVPKRDRAYSAGAKWVLDHVPALDRAYRAFIYWSFESRWLAFHSPSRMGDLMTKVALQHLEEQVPDPELRAKLRPDYPIGCKRILISDDYYPALTLPTTELVTDPIDRFEADAIVTADGNRRPIDTAIFATGFRSTEFLAPMQIVGCDGRRLEHEWQDGAEAYLGLSVSGFPNLFLLYGPNTNLGHNSILFMLECQFRYVLDCLERLSSDGVAALDVKPDAQVRFNQKLQAQLAKTVWEDGCRSWYKTVSGKVTNNWSTTTLRYWWATRFIDDEAFQTLPAPPPQPSRETAPALSRG